MSGVFAYMHMTVAGLLQLLHLMQDQHQNRLKQKAAKQVVVGMAEMLKIANAFPGDSALVNRQ